MIFSSGGAGSALFAVVDDEDEATWAVELAFFLVDVLDVVTFVLSSVSFGSLLVRVVVLLVIGAAFVTDVVVVVVAAAATTDAAAAGGAPL